VPGQPEEARGASDGGADDHRSGRRRSAGIYGTVVTAAIIAAGGNQLRTWALAVTIVVTLVVYWLAEEYAELLGEHTRAGHLPSRDVVRSSLGAAWPMVTASFLPLATLGIARLFGASSVNAAWAALGMAVFLLVFHGYGAARAAGLNGIRMVAVSGMAGFLGVVMIALKSLLQYHH
jgi:hypothetical protein